MWPNAAQIHALVTSAHVNMNAISYQETNSSDTASTLDLMGKTVSYG